MHNTSATKILRRLLALCLCIASARAAAVSLHLRPPLPHRQHGDPTGSAADQQTEDSIRRQMLQRERRTVGYRYHNKNGTPYRSIGLPPPITTHEWDGYCTVLRLSEQQHDLFARLHQEYLERDWAFRKEDAEPLYDESAEIFACADLYQNVDRADQWSRLVSRAHALLPRIFSLEDQLFTDCQPYLADDQLLRLEHVRFERRRVRSLHPPPTFPGSGIDLLRLLRQLHIEGVDVTPRDPAAFEAYTVSYDVTVTGLFEARNRKRRAVIQQGTPIRVRALVLHAEHPDDDATNKEANARLEEFHRLNRAELTVSRRIHDTTRRYVEILARLLPRESGCRFEERFMALAYRALFPDPFDLRKLLDAAVVLAELSNEQRARLDDYRIVYNEQYAAVCNQLIARYLEWHGHMEIEAGYDSESYERYRDEMQELNERRQAVCAMFHRLIMDTLSHEQSDQLRHQLAIRAEAITAEDARRAYIEMKTGVTWPGPSD